MNGCAARAAHQRSPHVLHACATHLCCTLVVPPSHARLATSLITVSVLLTVTQTVFRNSGLHLSHHLMQPDPTQSHPAVSKPQQINVELFK
jgi:hypothetical protein